jgi:hypothetical protein
MYFCLFQEGVKSRIPVLGRFLWISRPKTKKFAESAESKEEMI